MPSTRTPLRTCRPSSRSKSDTLPLLTLPFPYAGDKDRTCRISEPSRGRTSADPSVITPKVSPAAFTNSTSRLPSGYTSTATPTAPTSKLRSGRFRRRTTKSCSLIIFPSLLQSRVGGHQPEITSREVREPDRTYPSSSHRSRYLTLHHVLGTGTAWTRGPPPRRWTHVPPMPSRGPSDSQDRTPAYQNTQPSTSRWDGSERGGNPVPSSPPPQTSLRREASKNHLVCAEPSPHHEHPDEAPLRGGETRTQLRRVQA